MDNGMLFAMAFDYSMATSKGTKMPRGDKAATMKYEVSDFTYEEQENIAGILEAFDRKIQLNTEINENLLGGAVWLYQKSENRTSSTP